MEVIAGVRRQKTVREGPWEGHWASGGCVTEVTRCAFCSAGLAQGARGLYPHTAWPCAWQRSWVTEELGLRGERALREKRVSTLCSVQCY